MAWEFGLVHSGGFLPHFFKPNFCLNDACLFFLFNSISIDKVRGFKALICDVFFFHEFPIILHIQIKYIW